MKLWKETEPGPERIKLGLGMISQSRDLMERQQEEIDLLHRAQEKAESRASMICQELKDSEKELRLLENELDLMDDFSTYEQLTKHIIHDKDGVFPKEYDDTTYNTPNTPEAIKDANIAKQIQTTEKNRSDQEIHLQRRKALEDELTSIIADVDKKKNSLKELEINISDMEETRERKDREFNRIQRDLMELLNEQKYELDQLREKGIELETATSTSAKVASETAQKAHEHEKQTSLMFNQQEELMKFQFMSMSLSYFSSLNMLKQMKNIAQDATNTAVNNSAKTAAAAAIAAAAANLPSSRVINTDGGDNVTADIREAEQMLEKCKRNVDEKVSNEAYEFPSDCRLWSIADVSNWLRSLSLGAYVKVGDII